MAKAKNKKQKQEIYDNKYSHIPIEFNTRLEYMFNKYNLSQKQCNRILEKRRVMLSNLYYNDIQIVLFEEPEGAKRPRFRIVNRTNFMREAMISPNFVHVYSPNAKEDNVHMRRLMNQDLINLESMICTPCIVEYRTYIKTPNVFNIEDTFLSEVGLIRPLVKPDWDNIGKKYSDASNHNIWLDDSFVIDGRVTKYYSILPRVEIYIRYLNCVYNKYQYNTIQKRKDFEEYNCELEYFRL